jgi:ATP-dependent helicase HrpB
LALPIDDVLPELIGALDTAGRAVLQAPPGAGKTTGVPPALLAAGAEGRIVMLEPRRLAARAAAERMAEVWASPAGGPWATASGARRRCRTPRGSRS